MTLEQRVEALEAALANQQKAMKEVVSSAIQSAMRPGGCLSTALKSDASFKVAGGRHSLMMPGLMREGKGGPGSDRY
jgi:hypothetical protein